MCFWHCWLFGAHTWLGSLVFVCVCVCVSESNFFQLWPLTNVFVQVLFYLLECVRDVKESKMASTPKPPGGITTTAN